MLRAKRIVDEEETLEHTLDTMEDKFRLRGYPNKSIGIQRERIQDVNRRDALVGPKHFKNLKIIPSFQLLMILVLEYLRKQFCGYTGISFSPTYVI